MTNNHLLLYRLAEIMLVHEQHVLPVDLLFDDEQIGDYVKSIQIDSPYQKMLIEGVLTESVKDEKLFVSFTVEGYFHYVLGEVIYLKLKEENYPENSILDIYNNSKINGIGYAIEISISKFIDEGIESILINLIDKINPENQQIFIKPSLRLINRTSSFYFLELLFSNPSESDYECLYQIILHLENEGKYNLIISICSCFIEIINGDFDSPGKSKLFLVAFYYIGIDFVDDKNEKINRIVDFVKNNKNHLLTYQVSFYLVKLKYFELAISLLKKNLLRDSNYYNLMGLSYFGLKKYRLSYRQFKNYLNKATDTSDETKIGEALYNLSTCCWAFKDYNSSIKFNREAVGIESRLLGRYNASYFISLFSLALNYRILKKYDEAKTLLDQCLNIAIKTHNPKSSIFLDLYLTIGANYSDLKNTLSSIENYETAIDYIHSDIPLDKNPKYFLQEQYCNLGNEKFFNGNYVDSVKYFSQSIIFFGSLPDNNNFMPPFFELGESYRLNSDHKNAIDNYKKAIDHRCFVKEIYVNNPKFWIGIEYYEVGLELFGNNKKRDAINYFNISLSYLKKWKNKIEDIEWNNYVNSIIEYVKKINYDLK